MKFRLVTSKSIVQTLGRLVVLAGLVVGMVGHILGLDLHPKFDELQPRTAIIALIAVMVGIAVEIACRSD